MFTGIFAKEEVNTGRQREIDFLKAYTIIMMIIDHCIDELFVYEGHAVAEFIDDVAAESIGAQAFMICMGIGVIYSRKHDYKEYINRGISLLMAGQVLNLIRFALPFTINYIISGDI